MCIHKAWNLKYDTTKIAAATNEGCIGWLLEKQSPDATAKVIAKDLNLLRGNFLMQKISKLLAVG